MRRALALIAIVLVWAADARAGLNQCLGETTVVLQKSALSASDQRAHWLDAQTLRWSGQARAARYRLYHAMNGQIKARIGQRLRGADGSIELTAKSAALPERFRWLPADGVTLEIEKSARSRLDRLLGAQLLLVREDARGRVEDLTTAQLPGWLDARFSAALAHDDLGVSVTAQGTGFKLWAPTAREVQVCVFESNRPARATALRFDPKSGIWQRKLKRAPSGAYYQYLVWAFVPGVGIVRNRVSDPYSFSLNANGERTLIIDPDDPALKPAGWDQAPRPKPLKSPTDMVIYELHVRDFSVSDASVRPAWRGKYLGFTEPQSNGVKHLRALAQAGISDIHLLPAFDFATVPELGCVEAATQSTERHQDCFNWGYDPLHFGAPEGSYASDANQGQARVIEFRAMVQALHGMGLRVGMDVVYNHTSASGLNPQSRLDKIVPGYYHRLSLTGDIERSTCCENTATEHAMMAKLMIDTAVRWVRDYRIDSFRFDLMGHQPRADMEALQRAVDSAAGRRIELIGEGWNFGEIANNARFRQASQLELSGSGIATFSDRARDAMRGGGCCDSGAALVANKGMLTGANPSAEMADQVRVGLAGSIRDYRLESAGGVFKTLEQIDYAGQPAGYVRSPAEVVNYVENHDNPTLFDVGVFKLPTDTPSAERARVQLLGAAFVAFSQGIAYFHAGMETLRSKSLDRNSYDSGDRFNRIDWTFSENSFGDGVPPEKDKATAALSAQLLANPNIKPSAADIRFTRDGFLDLLRIRTSTTLLRLPSAAEINSRLRFVNLGPKQNPAVIGATIDGKNLANAGFKRLLYLLNFSADEQTLALPAERAQPWQLHPVQRENRAADPRLKLAGYDSATGVFTLPGRGALVYVIE